MADKEKKASRNLIPIPDTDLFIWADTYSWNVGRTRKCKPDKKNLEGISTIDVTYHSTLAQAVAEVINRMIARRTSRCKTLVEIRDMLIGLDAWAKGLFPDIQANCSKMSRL